MSVNRSSNRPNKFMALITSKDGHRSKYSVGLASSRHKQAPRSKGITPPEVVRDEGHQSLQLWFELLYAEYLTIPRSVLQSMPDEWQSKMASLLEDLDGTIDWRPKDGGCYRVSLHHPKEVWVGRGQNRHPKIIWGYEINDPLGDYQRGRRRIPHKT